ncbi:DUF3445 domain-containing protein [Sphingomonas floccifaciens]|uniref:DUF3445 domain-containing protein n=1 Tax=Sphingomonas floccifaciens TaxID=1844115 RepID=A0ABW4N8Q7_9SPHN
MTLGWSVEELVPVARGGGALRMGLKRLAPDAWLQPAPDTATRAAAFDVHPDSVQRLPWAANAEVEAAEAIGNDAKDLGGAARTVWEDLCLVQTPPGGGAPVLSAGAVAFPTDWRLADKLGLPLAAVHAPIHGYAEQLSAGVDHFIATLQPGAIFGRANWFVVPTADWRYLPAGTPEDRFAHVTADNAGDTLFVRSERQTLRRLPHTGAVLFTIGVYVAPLAALSDAVVARVAASIASIGAGEHERRAAPGYATVLADYVAGRAMGEAA